LAELLDFPKSKMKLDPDFIVGKDKTLIYNN